MSFRTRSIALGSAAAIMAAVPFGVSAPQAQETSGDEAVEEQIAVPVPDEIPIVLLLDLSTGQRLFQREIDRRFIPASVTKVMTVFTAFELIEKGELSPAMRFQISDEIDEKWSGEGSTMFLKAGEQPTIGELLLGVTTVSGNDASVALATAAVGSEARWLELMNANAAALGMRNTHFGGTNGFPDGGTTYTTAQDLAKLGQAIVERHPALYRRYFGKRRLTWRNIEQVNHDPVTGRVEGADGLKTGYTGEAGYTFLGSAERGGRRLMMVIAGAPSGAVRDTTSRKLLEWGFSNFEQRDVLPAGTIIGRARVQNGSDETVSLRLAHDLKVSAPRGVLANPTTEIVYRGPIMAPVAEGSQVATLRLHYEGQDPYDIPVEAAQTVETAGLFKRLKNGLMALFT